MAIKSINVTAFHVIWQCLRTNTFIFGGPRHRASVLTSFVAVVHGGEDGSQHGHAERGTSLRVLFVDFQRFFVDSCKQQRWKKKSKENQIWHNANFFFFQCLIWSKKHAREMTQIFFFFFKMLKCMKRKYSYLRNSIYINTKIVSF